MKPIVKYTLYITLGVLLLVIVCSPSYMYNNWRFNRGHVKILGEYFDNLKRVGYEVDPNTPSKSSYAYETSLGKVETIEYFTWRVRGQESNDWIDYNWELYPGTEESLEILKTKGIPTDYWWQKGVTVSFCSARSSNRPRLAGYKTILIPTNEKALGVHRELELRLPDEFSLPGE